MRRFHVQGALLCVAVLSSAAVLGQTGSVSTIIDATGDGAEDPLQLPAGAVVDASGNVFVVGSYSDNVLRITPDGVISEIIDAGQRLRSESHASPSARWWWSADFLRLLTIRRSFDRDAAHQTACSTPAE